jgi:hypothetical protein
LIAEIFVHGIGEGLGAIAFVGADVAIARTRGIKKNELFGMRDGETLEKDLAHDREDRGVGTDAERESEDGDGGEGRGFLEKAKGETNVLEKGFGDRERVLIVDEELGLFESTEFEDGLAASFLRIHAGAEVLLDGFVEVG